MSQEDLTQFLEAVRQDPSLQEKLRQPDADPVALAAAAGYRITPEESQHARSPSSQELRDQELENVAGGTGSEAYCYTQTPCINASEYDCRNQ